MTTQPLNVGETWTSSTLNQEFVITDGQRHTLPGVGDGSSERFVGYPAARQPDGRQALVALTEKPQGYPYDFVVASLTASLPWFLTVTSTIKLTHSSN
jgi:hypothetical protein